MAANSNLASFSTWHTLHACIRIALQIPTLNTAYRVIAQIDSTAVFHKQRFRAFERFHGVVGATQVGVIAVLLAHIHLAYGSLAGRPGRMHAAHAEQAHHKCSERRANDGYLASVLSAFHIAPLSCEICQSRLRTSPQAPPR